MQFLLIIRHLIAMPVHPKTSCIEAEKINRRTGFQKMNSANDSPWI